MVLNFSLGIIDIIAGVMLILYGIPLYAGSGFIATFGVFMLLKSAWLLLTKRNRVVFLIDAAAGILLISLYYGYSHYLFAAVGVLTVIKGAYNLVIGVHKS
jgi:hypothetical protein